MFWNGFTCDRISAFAEAVLTFTLLEGVSGAAIVFVFIVLLFLCFHCSFVCFQGSHGQDHAKNALQFLHENRRSDDLRRSVRISWDLFADFLHCSGLISLFPAMLVKPVP